MSKTFFWGCSSAGRAPALQAGGQEFDPPHLHQWRQEEKKQEARRPVLKKSWLKGQKTEKNADKGREALASCLINI